MGLKNWTIRMAVGIAVLTALTAVIPSFGAKAASDSLAVSEIEQVYVNMPEIRVYFSHLDDDVRTPGDIRAFYDDTTMVCESVSYFSETGDGVDYYVLLDTSSSILNATFEKMKEAIKSFNNELGEKDRMTLITFGDDEKELYRSDRSGDDLATILDKLNATSNSTSLFAGLSLAAQLSDSNNSDNYRRKICLLYTDGYDRAAGKETIDETKDKLIKYNLPVYTISAVATTSEDNAKLGELSRTTGGAMKVPGNDKTFTDMTREVVKEIADSNVLIFNADNNLVSPNEKKSLSVQFVKKDITKSKDVYFIRSQKDDTAPKIEKVESDGTDKIKVYFTEDVLDADNPKNYQVTNAQGIDMIVTEAVYEKKDGKYMATVTFSTPVIKGDYTISCRNICDNSMQKNAIVGSVDQYLEGVEAPNAFLQFILSWQGIILAAVVVIATAVLVIVIIRSRKKSARAAKLAAEKAAKEAAIEAAKNTPPKVVQVVQPVMQTPAPTPAPAPAVAPNPPPQKDPVPHPRQQVINDIERQAPKYVVNIRETNSIFMNIQLEGGESKMVELEFEDKLVVGRSQNCDVCIDDKFIARNQFVIEKQNNQYYVTDLNSTNGTSVNGIRITGKHRLEKGDVISAGMVRMTVSWK